MLYCAECKKKKNWPASRSSFTGTCEVCKKTSVSVYDSPTKDLPGVSVSTTPYVLVVEEIMEDIESRSGIGSEWSKISYEVKQNIRQSWQDILKKHLLYSRDDGK